jgi:membrane protease YdiL (CAAX protease family)
MNPTPEQPPEGWSYQPQYPPSYPGYPGEVPFPPFPEPPALDRPDRPFPGFLVALLLCILFLIVTQIPGAILATGLLVIFVLLRPGRFQNAGVSDILQSPEGSLSMGAAFAFTEILVIGFSLLMLRWIVGREWMRKVALRWPGWRVTLFALASTPGFVFLANLIYGWLVANLPSAKGSGLPGMEEMTALFQGWPMAFGVLVIGFGPGIGEELWCRAFLGRGLVGRYGVWVGVLATSFLFGAIHVDPAQGTMAIFMGVWLHYVYLTSRSLWMPILLHTVNNSLAVLAGHLAPLGQYDEVPGKLLESGGGLTIALPLAAACFLLGAVAWALYQSRTSLVSTDERPAWEPACPSVECPPADSGTRVVQGQASLQAVVVVVVAFVLCVACQLWLMRVLEAGRPG